MGVVFSRGKLSFLFGVLFLVMAIGGDALNHSVLARTCQKLTFVTQWSPQAQFAGYYVAKDMGLYQEHGLDVQILSGGADMASYRFLVEGRADIASTMLSTAIKKRVQGVTLVNIGQVVKRSSQMLVAYKSSQILEPSDFRSKRVSVWPEFRLPTLAFFTKFGIESKDIDIVTQGHTINLFLRKGVDATSAMWYNEYHTILNSGINEQELVSFMLADYGLTFPEDGLYSLREYLLAKPELFQSFIKASIKGWKYAFAHKKKALDIVMKYVNQASRPTNRVHQQWMLEKMQKIVQPEEHSEPISHLSFQDYYHVADSLYHSGLIDYIPGYHTFHDIRFSSH